MTPPIEEFLGKALTDFKAFLENQSDPRQQRRDATIDHRMRGAEQFARFLMGKPPLKGERIKGSFDLAAG